MLTVKTTRSAAATKVPRLKSTVRRRIPALVFLFPTNRLNKIAVLRVDSFEALDAAVREKFARCSIEDWCANAAMGVKVW